MVSVYLIFFLSALHAIKLLQPIHATILLGSSLTPTKKPTSWLSPSGVFAFGFYNKGGGFAVGIWLEASPNKTVVWTANRDDAPLSSNTVLTLTEGGLVQQSVGAPNRNISDTYDSSVSSAAMLDSGNFVLRKSGSKIIWETFTSPTDTILGGQELLAGNQLLSSASETNHSTGWFRLKMQQDGNLVLYPKGTEDIGQEANWASGTNGRTDIRALQLDPYGYMRLVNVSSIVKNITEGTTSSSSNGVLAYRATLDVDGIFRLYTHGVIDGNYTTTSIVVTTFDAGCKMKGICGINSYCTQMDAKEECVCPPGYNFVDQSNKMTGCSRNFTDEDCQRNKESAKYSMSPMKNMIWQDFSYDISQLASGEDCSDKCLGDCFCAAAMYVNNATCKMMRFPLKYGRRDASEPTTTFIKIGEDTPIVTDKASPGTSSTGKGTESRPKERNKATLIISVILAATCFSCAFAVIILLNYRRQIRRMSKDRIPELSEEIVLRLFSYNELQKATGNFCQELGKGAFGTVYKGALPRSGKSIAVKRLEKVVEEGEKEFRAETRAIGRTHHRNLVQLIGFCDEGSSRLLVYEYMSNGSLADLLFKTERQPCWNQRVRIALDVARGIRYLHEDCEPHIIHCDIKPQNILIDDSQTAKISDFGLAKLLMPNQTRTFTGIRGTRGYLAPEWQKNTPITVKTDVYSYGIVLLEIVCCRRHVELEVPEDEIILNEWVYNCFEARKLGELLRGEEVEVRMLERMVKVALWCIQNEPALRPSIKNVVLMLEGNMDIQIPPTPTSSTMS